MLKKTVFCKTFISFLFSLLLVTSFAAADTVHTITRKNVKVGYYYNEAFQEGTSEGAVKSGFGYEYLQKVSSLTGWKYEYIYGTWADIYNAFLRGEIDLLAGLGYSDTRLSVMSYPDYPMGYESYYLFVRSDDNSITLDPETLQGKIIGTIPGMMLEYMENWLAERNIDAKIILFDDTDDRDIALEMGLIDGFIGESSTVTTKNSTKPLMKMTSVNMYLCVSKNRPDLLKELNIALSELDSNVPYYISQLSEKYFSNSAVSTQVSLDEEEWLSEHGNTLRVGYMDNFLPYCGTDSTGDAAGILVDSLSLAFSNLRTPHDITITYHAYQNTETMIEAIHNHDIDVIFPVSNNVYYMEQNDLFQSEEVITSAMNMVYRDAITERTTETIAINQHNQIQYDYASTYMPDSEMILYDSVAECLDAVSRGEAGCAILSGLRASVLLLDSRYTNLKYVELPDNTTKCFGVSTHNIGVLTLLDRALNTLDSKDTMTFTYKYVGRQTDYSIREFLRRNMFMVFSVLLILSSAFIIIIAIVISKNHKEQLYYRFAYKDTLTGAFNRRAFDEDLAQLEHSSVSEFTCVSMDLNGLKKANDDYGHQAGDELISEACRLITEAFGEYGRIYRTGGDEYSAVMKADKATYEVAAARLETLSNEWKGTYSDTLRISVGAAFSTESETRDIHELWKLADQRMYDEKTRHYRKSGVDRRGQNEAHKALCAMYTKILKINVTDDRYEIINSMDDRAEPTLSDNRISVWLHDFGVSGLVHPDDLATYNEKTSLQYMRDYFAEGNKTLTLFYRRKYEDEFKHAIMQMIPAADYEDSCQTLYLYVNNIETFNALLD